ncbi:MAG TPA: phosphatase PAP2 family protein [Vicinamibacterales bacterium]|jgi:undecaprenyl-diphosphatase
MMLGLDYLVDAWILSHRVAWLNPVMRLLSAFGKGGLGWIAVAALLTIVRRLSIAELLRMILAIICTSLVINWVIKPVVARPRPFQRTAAVHVIGPRPHDSSFPSGHSGNAAAAAMVLSLFLPAARPLWWLLAAAIGYSRVYLGDHFPLDVLVGGAIGAAVGWMVARISVRSPGTV